MPNEDRIKGKRSSKGLAITITDWLAIDDPFDGSLDQSCKRSPTGVVKGNDQIRSIQCRIEPERVGGIKNPRFLGTDFSEMVALDFGRDSLPTRFPSQIVNDDAR